MEMGGRPGITVRMDTAVLPIATTDFFTTVGQSRPQVNSGLLRRDLGVTHSTNQRVCASGKSAAPGPSHIFQRLSGRTHNQREDHPDAGSIDIAVISSGVDSSLLSSTE